MVSKAIIVCVALLFPLWCQGQASAGHDVLHPKEKKKWERTYQQLKKTIGKDSTNAAARYLLAGYFFSPANPAYDIDSAHHYTVTALAHYQRAPFREREKMKRLPLDSILLVRYREKIDSAAFERACKINTEQAYQHFLNAFPDAAQREEARARRDEAAFLDAVKANTYHAFQYFLEKYPGAGRTAEARDQYEKLLFEARTSDQRLASYKKFLKEHPRTPFRNIVERRILEMSTASGSEESFITFMEEYPQSHCRTMAMNILFHLLTEDASPDIFPVHLRNDSLSRIVRAGQGYLIPFLGNGQFGFMDQKGETVINAGAEHIDDAYLCGGIREEIIVLPDKIVAANGVTIHEGAVTSVDDLGFGFLKIEAESCMRVLHKSGFAFPGGCIDDAKLIGGRFVALRKGNLWSIWTLTGVMLHTYEFDDITTVGDVVLFHKDKKTGMIPAVAVAGPADHEPLNFDMRYDEVKPWQGNYIWARTGEEEMVYTEKLSPYVGRGRHRLTQTFFGALGGLPQGFVLYNRAGKVSDVFDAVQIADPWAAVRTKGRWHFVHPFTQEKASALFDSVTVAGRFAVGINRDSLTIFSALNEILKAPSSSRFEFVPGRDSSAYFSIYEGGKIAVFNEQGKQLFAGVFDRVQHAGGEFFIAQKKEKKGLLNKEGKVVLPLEYDAIGTVNNGVISLLKSMKFGLYDYARNRLIKTGYQKNLTPFNHTAITAFKDGAYGFISWDNKPLSDFEFDEVRPWNDSTALVRKVKQWALFDLKTRKLLMENIKTLKMLNDTPEERLAVIRQGDYYGVISSKKGIVIPLSFSDIINVGTPGLPTYFTEKHVAEADLFVVIYYDSDGKLIRREVYEHDEYEKIYCRD